MRFLFGDCTVDTDREELRVSGAPVQLGPVGYPLLVYLVENRGRLVSKAEIHQVVWQGRPVSASTIPTAVSALRKSIGDDPQSARFIRSVYGRGYRFVGEVRTAPSVRENIRADILRVVELDERLDFVGRAEELRLLQEGASPGAGPVLVAGAAGAGKSRLLERFAAERATSGECVLFARCAEVGGATPYAPVADLVHQVRAVTGDALSATDPDSLQMIQAFEADRQLFRSDSVASASLGVDGRYRLESAFAKAFEMADPSQPVVAIIDDFHRADAASAQAIRFILSRVNSLSLVVAYRDGELTGPVAFEVAALSRGPTSVCFEVASLNRSESRELIEHRIGIQIEECLADRIFDLTGGNPFFLTRVSELLAVTGPSGEVVLSDDVNLPNATRDAVLQHVSALSDDCREMLTRASVLGREFSRELLRAVLCWPPQRFDQSLKEAVRASVLNVSESVRFSHVLLRDALYEVCGAAAPAFHADSFRMLERFYGAMPGRVVAARAAHAVAAGPCLEADVRIEACREAAAWARERFAFSDAADWYDAALGITAEASPGDQVGRCELLIALAECLHRSDRREEGQDSARRGFSLARKLGEVELMGRAALAYSPGFFAIEVGVVDEFLVGALSGVRGRLSGTPATALSVEVTARLAMALYWTNDRVSREALANAAVEQAQAIGGSVVAYAMTAREVALWDSAQPQAKEAVARLALRMAIDAGEHEMELVYRVYRISSLLQLGDMHEAYSEIEAFSAKARLVGHSNSLWFVDLFSSMKAMVAGDREAAALATDRFVEKGRSVGDRNADHCRVVHRVYQRMEFGPIGDAADIAEEQWRNYQRVGAYRCSLPFLYWESGEELAARVSFESLAREGFSAIPRNVEWLIGMAMLSEGCAAIGDARRAEELYALLSPHGSECVVVGFGVAVFRPVACFLGRLATTMGRFRGAEEHFSMALGVAERAASPSWRAHAEYGLAQLLVRRRRPGDLARAGNLLRSCLEISRALAMNPLHGRADRLFRLLNPPA